MFSRRSDKRATVAHHWAHGITEKTPNAHAFFFEGDTIYSYGHHFPIATLHQRSKRTKKIVLFTLRTYSPTTSNHINDVRSAVTHMQKIYCQNPEYAAEGRHSDNLEYWENKAKEQYSYIASAKKPDLYFNSIKCLREELMKYCKYFGITRKNNNLLQNFESIWLRPSKKVIEAAKERKCKESKAITDREIKRIENERRIAEVRVIIAPDVIKAWRTQTLYIGKGLAGEGLEKGKEVEIKNNKVAAFSEYTLLRSSSNEHGPTIETSKSVHIPIDVAKRFYLWIIRALNKGGCDGNCTESILGYKVTKLDHTGLMVGCHDFEMIEISNMADTLDWPDVGPAAKKCREILKQAI